MQTAQDFPWPTVGTSWVPRMHQVCSASRFSSLPEAEDNLISWSSHIESMGSSFAPSQTLFLMFASPSQKPLHYHKSHSPLILLEGTFCLASSQTIIQPS